MNHEVGQIVFVMLRKQRQVLPVLVVEETTKKTLDGQTYSYTVQLPNAEKTCVSLEKMDADVFETLDDVKESMLRSAATTIENIILSAEAIGSEHFSSYIQKDNAKEKALDSSTDTPKSDTDSEELRVDLGNGVKGKIDISNLKSHGVI